MKKRVWSMLLTLIAMAVMLSVGVSAANEPVAKIGETPYTDLHEAMVAAKAGETVLLLSDVDLAGTEWEPVSFKGKFDGQGYTISNLTINKPGVSSVGFITSLNSTFENVTFQNPTVTGGENTGVVAGRAGGGAALAKNITVTGTIKVETTHSGYARAAVIVGGWAYGKYENITVDGVDAATSYVKHTGGGDGRYVAGIVGHADDVDSYTNCVVKNITLSGGWLSGGIAGPGPADGLASGCSVENVKIGADYSGGMFGWYYGSGTIEDCSIKNVEFTAGSDGNGAIGGYSNNTSANVVDVTIENVGNANGKPLMSDVAEVAGVYYTSLQAAIAAAGDDETITVLNNFAEVVAIPEGECVILDLNGKKLTGSILAPNADLTIQNGSIVNTNSGVSALEINAGTLTLTDVTMNSARHAVRIDGAVTATINGGLYCSAIGNGTGTYHAVNVSGAANVTIVDGTFIGPKETKADSGSAVQIQAGAAVTIEGGDFSNGKNNTLSAAGTLSVTGGTYDQDPSAYCADGYMAVKNGNVYAVGAVVATINGTPYTTIQAALDAATNSGDVVTILAGTHEIDAATAKLVISNSGITVQGQQDGEGNNLTTLKFTSLPRLYAGLNVDAVGVTVQNLNIVVAESCADPGLWCDNVLGHYYENVKDRSGLVVDGCNFVNESGATLMAIMINEDEYTVKNSTFTGFAYGVWCEYNNEAVAATFTDNTFTDTPSAVSVAWKVGTETTAVTVTGNEFNGGKVTIHDFSADSGAINVITISNNKNMNLNLVGIDVAGESYYAITFDIPVGAFYFVEGATYVDGVCMLPDGTYTVTVTKSGYYDATKTFTVNGGAQTVVVELTAIPATYRISVADAENGTVTLSRTRASRNSLITITAAPDAGFKVAKVEVTNFRGEAVDVTDAGNGTYTFRMPGSTTNVSVTFECDGSTVCSTSHLTDVDHSQWYHIAVDYVVSNGMMVGTGEGKFSPEAAMERAMVIQVLYNMENTPAVTYTGKFSDVADGKWYTNAIEWGVANGILVDYGTAFDPNGAISREEMVRMMYNYARYKGKDTSARGDLSKYTDGATTSDWAVEYVKWAVGSGVMVGGETILNPTGNANRAEVAQIFKNFHEIYG